MAFTHGKKARFLLEDSSTISRDISAYMNTAGLNRSAETAETSVFSSTAKTYVPGLKDGTIPLGGVWDPTLDGYMDGVVGKDKAYKYFPASTAAGSVHYGGDCIITSYDISSALGGAVSWSGSLQLTGTVNRSTT